MMTLYLRTANWWKQRCTGGTNHQGWTLRQTPKANETQCIVAWVPHFWNDLSNLFVADVNNWYEKNELTRLLETVSMQLLRKGEKCRLVFTNYRSISVLSVFYKMASGVIKRRLEKVMVGLIGCQQKAYSTEKNIGSVQPWVQEDLGRTGTLPSLATRLLRIHQQTQTQLAHSSSTY